jgi:DNA polymerase phi
VLHGQISDDADALKTIKSTLKVIDGLKAQIKKEEGGHASDVPYGFEILFFHVLLHSLLDQEEGAGLLGDLLNCFEKMEQQNKPAKKKSNKKKAVVEEQDDGEPEPIEVIVDILLSFLTSASPMLKGITEHVFELFSPLVTKQAMENLINVSFSMQV